MAKSNNNGEYYDIVPITASPGQSVNSPTKKVEIDVYHSVNSVHGASSTGTSNQWGPIFSTV